MKTLIIGGTRFLGRHIAEYALKRNHEITLFNRGISGPALFPEVEHITGDRNKDLALLANHRWDVVIDTCGYLPKPVKASAALLQDISEQYIFISTISVYDLAEAQRMDENAALHQLPPEANPDEFQLENYGALKVLCENAVNDVFDERACIVRPGLIVGPFDPSDRFTYWVRRIAAGGEVLLPEPPDAPTQFVDVRDISDWIVQLAEKRINGTFNATSPIEHCIMGELAECIKELSGSNAHFNWLSEEFLLNNEVQPWSDLPLWLPRADNALMTAIVDKALQNGLTLRPVAETVQDTLNWDATRNHEDAMKAGITLPREKELLQKWRSIPS